jgi:hypothetical protein
MNHRGKWSVHLLLACFLSLSSLLLPGCFDPAVLGRDWEFYVQNTTNNTWRIRVAVSGDRPATYSVHEVLPGADGVSVQWYGNMDARIELLDSTCNVVGIFEKRDADVYTVAGVTGVVGQIEPSGTRMDKWNTPEIGPISECGGYVHP